MLTVTGDGKTPIYYFSTSAAAPRGDFPAGAVTAAASAGNYFVCQNLCANCGVCPTMPTPPTLPAAFYHQNVQYALIQAQNFFNYQIQQNHHPMIDQEEPGVIFKDSDHIFYSLRFF